MKKFTPEEVKDFIADIFARELYEYLSTTKPTPVQELAIVLLMSRIYSEIIDKLCN